MVALQQNTPTWLAFRRNKIGASDAPIIMGESPWKTPYQLWLEKTGQAVDEPENGAMRRGKELEPQALGIAMLKLGVILEPCVKIHPKYDWMMASLDGLSLDGKIALEIKSPGKKDHATAVSGEIPTKYFPQLQHQLEVLTIDKIKYVSFDGKDIVILEQGRDEKYIKKLIEKEMQFREFMETNKAPPLCDRDTICRDDDSKLVDIAQAYIQIQTQLKSYEVLEKELREQLIVGAKGVNTTVAGLKINCIERAGSVDYSSIPELKGVNLDSYRKPPTTMWRICQ